MRGTSPQGMLPAGNVAGWGQWSGWCAGGIQPVSNPTPDCRQAQL